MLDGKIKSFRISYSLALKARLILLFILLRSFPCWKKEAFSSTEKCGWQTPDLNLFLYLEVWKKQQQNCKLSSHYSWIKKKKKEYFYRHIFLNKSCHLILLTETCKSKEVEVCCSTETGICEGFCRMVKNKELTSREVANNICSISLSRLCISLSSIQNDMKLLKRKEVVFIVFVF